MTEEAWHALSEAEIFSSLKTTKKGLSDDEAETRLSSYGFNELKEEKKISHLGMFLNQFKSFLVIILLVAFVLSLFFKEWLDASVIFVIIVINQPTISTQTHGIQGLLRPAIRNKEFQVPGIQALLRAVTGWAFIAHVAFSRFAILVCEWNHYLSDDMQAG